MQERRIITTHKTIMKWILEYSPIIDKAIRKYIKPTTILDKRIKLKRTTKNKSTCLYRVFDFGGIILIFMFQILEIELLLRLSLKKP